MPAKIWGSLSGYKTYVVGVLGILTAIAGALDGDLTQAQAFQACLTALSAMCIRHGVSTGA